MKNLAYLFVFIFLLSCSPDEVEPDPSSVGSMTCTMNGEPWSATSFNNTILHITDSEPNGKRLDLRGKGMGYQIILSCGVTSSSTGTTVPIATYTTNGATYEALATVTNTAGWDVLAIATGYSDDPATITISSINGTTKTCSGTFSFKAADVSTEVIKYDAVAGVFTDLKYIVM